MDKWILICGLKKQSIFPWGKMTLASLDSNDCLPLSSGSSPPNTVSAAWPVCDLRSVWLIDLQTLRSYKAPVPLAGGQSGPERFGCVLFLWDTPALTAPRESMTLTFHLLSPVLASGILSLSLTSKPCHGPEMLAAGCHFLLNGLTSWPRGVRGPPRHSKSQPHPWRMLGHPADSLRQGLQRPRTCPPPCHLCCWAVLSRSVVSNFLQPVLVPVFILLINLTGVHFPDSDPYRTNLPTACQTLTLYLRGEISVEFSNPIPWLKTVFIMSKQKPLARIAHLDLYCLLHYGKYMHA